VDQSALSVSIRAINPMLGGGGVASGQTHWTYVRAGTKNLWPSRLSNTASLKRVAMSAARSLHEA
jgi:hypothetical protein